MEKYLHREGSMDNHTPEKRKIYKTDDSPNQIIKEIEVGV
jgi:hypothetical protein